MSFVYSGPRLLLLRHGQTEWNLQGRLQGRKNSDLTELGRVQAREQGLILKRVPGVAEFDAVCSPLGRARETAEIALGAIGKTPRSEPLVQEISAGDWEGMTYDDIMGPEAERSVGDLMRLFLNAPGGEGFDRLQDRCARFLSGIDRPTIIVSHWIALAVMRGMLRGLPRHEIESLDRPQGVVFDIDDGRETLLANPAPAV